MMNIYKTRKRKVFVIRFRDEVRKKDFDLAERPTEREREEWKKFLSSVSNASFFSRFLFLRAMKKIESKKEKYGKCKRRKTTRKKRLLSEQNARRMH